MLMGEGLAGLSSASKARTWASIQSRSACVQLALAKEALAKPLFQGIKTESDGAQIRIGARTPFYFASASKVKLDAPNTATFGSNSNPPRLPSSWNKDDMEVNHG